MGQNLITCIFVSVVFHQSQNCNSSISIAAKYGIWYTNLWGIMSIMNVGQIDGDWVRKTQQTGMTPLKKRCHTLQLKLLSLFYH